MPTEEPDSSHEATRHTVQALVDDSEMVDVRLTQLHLQVADDVPDEVNAEFGIAGVQASGTDGDPGFLTVNVSHSARFFSAEDTVASIAFTHSARFRYTGAEPPDQETVQQWVLGNVYFMLHPYVRETLHSACVRGGLPSVVLGYLQRGQAIPRNITVVVSTTRFDNTVAPPEDAETTDEADPDKPRE